MDSIRTGASCTTVLIIVDDKMKFEPIRFREAKTEFFGKQGMSWNGSVVFYKKDT